MKRDQIVKNIRQNPFYAKAGIAAVLSVICFAVVYMWDNGKQVSINEQGKAVLERGGDGEDAQENMKVWIGDTQEEVEVNVSGKAYSDRELEEAFEKSGEYLEKAILGDNKTLDEVREDLDLVTEIPDTSITVSWNTDNYNVMDTQGNIKEEGLTEEGTVVKLTAILKYGEETASHEFFVKVFPPFLSQSEANIKELENELKDADESTMTKEYMILPDSVNGEKLRWEYGINTRAFGVLIMGLGMACMIIVSSVQSKKEEMKKQERQMQIDYPHIINKFNLYIRAGMTVRKAWFRIAQDYEKKSGGKKGRKAYDEMVCTMHRIQGGAPEGECYENYGMNCNIAVYKKFGTILSQNLRKGSRGITDLLGREAEEAFDDRKNLARKLGEEAGTKLMIPMFLMLIVVFAIVIVPAFFSIQV